jgi:hypothetical protein
VSSDLIRELEALGAEVDWPATPAFARTEVSVPSVSRETVGTVPSVSRRRLVLAVALAVLLAAAGALAATGVIHFGGATIKRVDRLPAANPVASMQLGTPVRIAEARRLLPGLRLPRRLENPDAAYQDPRAVSFVYLDAQRRPRAILAVLREGPELLQKLVGVSTQIRRVRVDGAPGLYVAGTHVVDFLYGPGRRLSRPTVLWQRDGLLYRLEAADALTLASAR